MCARARNAVDPSECYRVVGAKRYRDRRSEWKQVLFEANALEARIGELEQGYEGHGANWLSRAAPPLVWGCFLTAYHAGTGRVFDGLNSLVLGGGIPFPVVVLVLGMAFGLRAVCTVPGTCAMLEIVRSRKS